MNRYIVIAFAFLGVWFYVASGGADFEPGENGLVVFVEPKPFSPRDAPSVDLVARADTSPVLTDVVPTRAEAPEPVQSDATEVLTLVPLEAPVVQPEPVVEPDPIVITDVITETPEPEVALPVRDLRFVDGDRVNMRGGPGTDYEVVGRLVRDDMVEILKDEGNGWLHLRDTASGQEGWMADWLVTASN